VNGPAYASEFVLKMQNDGLNRQLTVERLGRTMSWKVWCEDMSPCVVCSGEGSEIAPLAEKTMQHHNGGFHARPKSSSIRMISSSTHRPICVSINTSGASLSFSMRWTPPMGIYR
jgi:hypothetical protein